MFQTARGSEIESDGIFDLSQQNTIRNLEILDRILTSACRTSCNNTPGKNYYYA